MGLWRRVVDAAEAVSGCGVFYWSGGGVLDEVGR